MSESKPTQPATAPCPTAVPAAPDDVAVVEELQRSQELSRRLIEAMPGGVVHVGVDGSIRVANGEALRILGMSFDALSGKYTRDFETQTFFEDGSSCPVSAYPVARALTTGRPHGPTTIGVRIPDGSMAWAVYTAVPILDRDGVTEGAVATFIDITERKRLERELRAAQKMEAIGRLAGGVAHDFNNLLTVITGSMHVVSESMGRADPRRADLSDALDACEHAGGLTRQLLAFARCETVAPTAVSLDTLVHETSRLMQRTLGNAIELELDIDSNVWPVTLDYNQFQQVLLNLTSNARDAMPRGGKLRVAVTNGEDAGVQLRVTDSGVGMDPATVDRMFDPFFTTKDAGRGTGLGLAMCHGIVTQAGGTISVTSEPGCGTTVEVRFPRAAQAGAGALEGGEENAAPTAGETILLVEDEVAVRRVVRRLLEHHGYRVLVSASGAEALTCLTENGKDVALLLTDVVMPNMSGPELVRRVHARRPDIEVIYMSGYSEDSLKLVDGVLVRKPFRADRIAAVVRKQLDRAARREPGRAQN